MTYCTVDESKLAAFTVMMPALRASKVRDAMRRQVRYNGVEFIQRGALVERIVREGGSVTTRHGAKVLMSTDGAWLDGQNIKATGIAYAEFLISAAGVGSGDGGANNSQGMSLACGTMVEPRMA